MSLYYLTSHSGKEVVYFVYILKAAILIFSMVEVRYDHNLQVFVYFVVNGNR